MSNDAKSFVDLKQAVNSTDSLSINKNENVSTSSTVTYAAGKSPNDVIKKFMEYLDKTTSYGTTALDGAVQACSNFTGIQDAINHMISDCQTANSYTEFLAEKCGIVPDNEDTGAITGFDAGGSTVKDQYSIVPESGSKINFTGSSFTVDGLTVNLGLYDSSYQFTPTTYNNLTSAQKSIWQSAYTWWVKGALDLNAESYGKNFGFSNYSSATTKTINFGFQNGSSGTLAWTSFNIDAYGKNQALGMAVNMNYYDAIDQSDPNGSSSTAGATYLDRTLAHEFTHAVMVSNIDYYDKLPKFIREGMAELTHGIDDERGNRIINLAQNPSSLRSALDLSLTSGGDTNTYAGGYMFLRYLAQQGAVVTSVGKNIHNSTSNTLITGTAYDDTVYNTGTGSHVTISVGAGADSIHNSGNYASIVAGSSNDTITSNAYFSTIFAGDGDDKISVSTSSDYSYIDGGDGADTITGNFWALSIGGGAGKDSIYSYDSNFSSINGGDDADTITGSFWNSTISGGYGNDLISIGGGSGNIVNTGYGNDTVINSSSTTGYVKYLYTGGNDLIRGWANADTLSLTGGLTFSGQSTVGTNVLLNVSNGYTITLEGAAGKTIQIYPEPTFGRYILNSTSNTLITGTNYDDEIYNTGSSVTISVGAGADSMYNNGSYASILTGSGEDTIDLNSGYYSTIFAGDGDDKISVGSSGDYSYIDGGAGNDSVYSYDGDHMTIYGGYANDTIAGIFYGSSINGGYGNDLISIGGGGANNKVHMGYGNDTVYSSATYGVEYFYSGGRDYLSGVKSSDTIRMANGTVRGATIKSGSHLVISLANGSDSLTLAGAANSGVQIVGLVQDEGNYIYNYNSNLFVTGTGVKDTVYNTGSKVTISVGAGADSIFNWGSYASILADTGNDTVINNASNATILAGGGDDTVSVGASGDYSRIDGGSGNDSIYSSDGDYMTIYGSDGADTITGWYYISSIDGGYGNDLISVNGSWDSTINAGYGNDTIISSATSGVTYLYTGGYDLIRGWADADTLSLTGGLKFNGQSTVGNNVLLNVSNGYTITLEGAAGKTINIYPELDTGAKNIYNSTASTLITGTAQNDTIRNTGKYVTISVGGGNDSISNTGMYASILAGEDVDTVMSSGRYSTIFAGGGNDIASLGNAGDYSFVDLGAGNDSIFIPDGDYVSVIGSDGNDTITGKFWSSSINGGAGNDLISIFGGGAKNTVDAGTGNDTIISALASGIFYNFTGGNDLIQGWTNRDSMSVSSSWERVTIGNDVLVSVEGVGVVTLVGASGKTINVYPQDLCVEIDTSGVNIVNRTSSTLVVGKDYDDTIRNLATNVTISVGSGVDSIYNTGTYTSIIAGADNDTIINTGSYATIYAGEGDDIATINGYRSQAVFGNGDDTVFTASGNYMTISGDVGNDRIIGRFSYSSIDGGADNDFISIIGGSRNTVDAGEGDDTIISAITSGVFYNFTGGNDIIQGWTNRDSMSVTGAWERVTIGNDVLVSVEGVGVATLYGARGKTISVYPRELSAEKVGFDIYNTKSATLITGNAYGDTINNRGSRVTVSVGAGVDSIYNTGSYASILAGADGDSIINIGSYSTIDAGEGDDKVTISGSRLQIDLGTGNDEFFGRNNLTYATIDAGDGQDNITGRFYYSSIYGGADDDYISIGGGLRNTVDAGAGNDTIISAITGGVFYNFTGGNDIIQGWTNRDSMSVTGAWERVTVGNDILVSVEGVGVTTLEGAKGRTVNVYPKDLCVEIDTSGAYVNNSAADTLIVGKPYDDTIRNTGARVTVSVGAGADSIYNNGAQASIMAGDGNDTIYNYNSGDNSFFDGGAGNDTIFSSDGDNVTISGGDGNDTITGKFWTASISGGADNDFISIGGGSKNTINTGAGNDTIISSIKKGFLFQYEGGDDYVSGWSSNDSISLPSSVTYAQSTVGSDVQISLSSGDVVTLAGASGKTINIFPEKVSTPTITAQQFIKDFMKSLDTTDKSGVAALNEAISVASGGYYSDMQTARNKMVADCQSVGNATTFLVDKCGIDLYNTDTGAITGYDAGGSTTPKTASSVIPESGSLDTSFTGNYFLADGLSFYLTDMSSNYTLTWKNYSDLTTDAERFVWRALKTWWGKGSLDINAESYGNNFGFDTTSSATTKNMYFAFVNEPSSGALATTWNWSSGGQVTQLAMTVNMNYYSGIDTADPNGSSATAGSISLDRVLAHEFTHAVMAANINYFNDLPQFIKEGMAELTHGIDDARGYNILNLAGNSSSLYNALDVTNVQTGTVEAYAGGFMFLRYIAKQVAENYSANNNLSKPSGSQNLFSVITSEIEINGDTLTANPNFSGKTIDLAQYSPNIRTVDASALNKGVNITGNTYANEILGGSATDTISGNTGGDTIHGGAGNDIIFGDAGDDNIFGDAGIDTLSGGSGNNTLTGGDGADTFVHTTGNDFITDYTEQQDKIQLVDGAIIGSSISGADVVLKFMTSSVTVKGGKDKDITVIDSDGVETTQKYFDSTTDALWFDGGNNFITEDAQIDSITELSETNYSIENIFATQNYSALTTNETLVTAAEYLNKKQS